MSAARPLALISVEDYLAGEVVSRVKHEYYGGYVYAMAGGTNAHNTISVNFVSAMHRATRTGPCQPFNSDTKVRVPMATRTRFYYPDGMVVCDSNSSAGTYQDRPVVIAEVASRSTWRTDAVEKREAYLTLPSLMTYLMIEVARPRVVVYQRVGESFETYEYEGTDATIPLDAIGATLVLADVYERIDFAVAAAEDEAEFDAL